MIRKLTAVVADIDGTINVKGSEVMPQTREALEELHERGILFGTASGRPFDYRTLDKAREWGLSFEFDLAIGTNGGDIWDRAHGDVEHIMLLERDYIGQICEFMWPLDCNVIVYENAYDHVLAKRLDKRLENSIFRNGSKVEIVTPDVMAQKDAGKIEIQYDVWLDDQIMAAIAAHPSPHWSTVRTFAGAVEFMKPGLDKGVGLRRLARRMGIPLDEVMAFGDMDNDVPMIREAGWGVAMANGCDDARAIADAITEFGVTEDGMGRYLKTHVLL